MWYNHLGYTHYIDDYKRKLKSKCRRKKPAAGEIRVRIQVPGIVKTTGFENEREDKEVFCPDEI